MIVDFHTLAWQPWWESGQARWCSSSLGPADSSVWELVGSSVWELVDSFAWELGQELVDSFPWGLAHTSVLAS